MDVLLSLAADQHGYVATNQLVEAGMHSANIQQRFKRGTIERVAPGVYRVPSFPLRENDEFMIAVLWAKGRGVIFDQSALVLWDLCDVNPRTIHVGVPKSYKPRKKQGENYTVHSVDLNIYNVDHVDKIPVLTPFDAISRSINSWLRTDLAEQAIGNAFRRGHLSERQKARLWVALDDRETS